MRCVTFILFFQLHINAQIDSSKIEMTDIPESVLVDESPEFPGGFRSMMHFIYTRSQPVSDTCDPLGCKRFFVKFMIDTMGVVKNVSITTNEPQCFIIQEEFMRVFKLLPNWKPGYQKGKPINTYYTLPFRIRFN
jgi:protein TonB